MRAIPCPISSSDLAHLYLEEKLTDEAIVQRIGEGATLKRVRAWRVRFGSQTLHRADRNEVLPIEGSLRSLLIGSMLGDGRLSRTAHASRYQENHADDQKSYLAWKVVQWGPWVKDGLHPVCWKQPGGVFHGWRFHTVSHHSLNEWHSLFYDIQAPKRLRPQVVDLVDEYALAIWFMDDGSSGWWPRITFGMGSFSRKIALNVLEKFGLHPRWELHKGETGDFIFGGEDQAHHFIGLVQPHMFTDMQRKMTFGFQGPHYRRMASELGQSVTTVSRHLEKLGVHHPRKVGRPTDG